MKKFFYIGLILFLCFIALYVYINMSKINNNIAVSNFNNGNFERALSNFKRAVLFKNKENIVKYNLASTNTRMYEHEEAKKEYLELLSKNISQELKSEIYFNLGNIECMYENFDEALEYYYIALTMAPQDKDTKYNIELVEYLNRPIIYNNEILLLPKQKLAKQIEFIDKEILFKKKLHESLILDISNSYTEYINIKGNNANYLELYNINKQKKLSIQKSIILFNNKCNEINNNKILLEDKKDNIQKELNSIRKYIIDNSRIIENYEHLKLKILNATTRKQLSTILSNADKYETKKTSLIKQFNPVSSENMKRSFDIVIRDCIHLLNNVQYSCFIEQNFNVLSKLKDIINESNNISPTQTLEIVKLIVYTNNNNLLVNASTLDNYISVAETYENRILKSIGNKTIDGFIAELSKNDGKKISYEKSLELFYLMYKYYMFTLNIHLLFDSLLNRDLYDISCIQYAKYIVEQNKFLSNEDIMAIYQNLDVILSNIPDFISQAKKQKLIYEDKVRGLYISINEVVKLLSKKHYINSINSSELNFDNLRKAILVHFNNFEKEENKSKEIKDNMQKISKKIKELKGELISVEQNKHIYEDIKTAIKTLQNKLNNNEDSLKQEELILIKDVKIFVEDFIRKLSQQVVSVKYNIKYIEKLLTEVVRIDEFIQGFSRDKFIVESKDLEVEINNFEQYKKYFFDDENNKESNNITSNVNNLFSKSVYQKEKLDALLANEQLISKQIMDLNVSMDNLLQSERKEINMLENDLVEKQLALVKYYVSVENDNTKKALTRQLMQTLYKEKYETEHTNTIEQFNLDSFNYSNFRDSILILYKSYVFQVRELNKLIFRMKIINSILDLELRSKLKERIEFNKKYIGNNSVRILIDELDESNKQTKYKNEQEMKDIISIFKENMASGIELKEKLVNYYKKQQQSKRELYQKQQQSVNRKIILLSNKSKLLEEHLKHDAKKENVKQMKEEIKNIEKEKNNLEKMLSNINDNIRQTEKSINIEQIMVGIIKSSDAILKNIDEESNKSKENSNVDRILHLQSSRDKSVPKKNNNVVQNVKNDW